MEAKIFGQEKWEPLVNRTFNTLTKLVITKGHEYSGDHDRLANFRRNAEKLGMMKEQVWAVYAAKHWDAIMQYIIDLHAVDKLGKPLMPRSEPMAGRAHDLMVYLLLFLAMLEENSGAPIDSPSTKEINPSKHIEVTHE